MLGILVLIAGLVFMLIPFIPLGYILVLAGALFLAPVIPPVGRLMNKLKRTDRKNRIGKAEQEMNKVEEVVDEMLIKKKQEKRKDE